VVCGAVWGGVARGVRGGAQWQCTVLACCTVVVAAGLHTNNIFRVGGWQGWVGGLGVGGGGVGGRRGSTRLLGWNHSHGIL
jgi:hypothetical protein